MQPRFGARNIKSARTGHTFRVPLYPLTLILAIAGCLWIIKDLRPHTLIVFAAWAAFALILYFAYSIKNSHLNKAKDPAAIN